MKKKPTYRELENEVLRLNSELGKKPLLKKQKADKFFEAMVNSLSEPLHIIDKDYNILFINNAFIKLLKGLRFPHEIIGKKVYKAFNIPFEKPLNEYKRVFISGKELVTQEVTRIKENEVYTITTKTPIIENGEVDKIITTINDITKQKKAELALKESEEKFRVIVETASDWIWEVDITGKFTYSSPNIYSILGYSKEEIIGKTPFDFMPETEKERVSKIFHEIVKQNKPIDKLENINIHKNGDLLVLQTSALPFFDSNNRLLGYRGIDRDITDHKKVEQALIEREAQLRESNITKDKFFSILAHDLKSPFNTMLGFSNLLINNFDKYDLQKQKQFLDVLNQDLKNTYKLLENLLLWSRSQRGTIDFNTKKENLYLLSVETLSLLNHLSENKSIILINQVPKDIYIKADKNMLLTILRNLISNAIKFTPQSGEITISADSKTNKKKQNYIEISVKDSGVGIAKENLSNLFKISENISTKGTEGETGTGLGLILCKEFVEKHGGEIWVESEVGIGSEFIFSLPLM
ncbi:MAG: PAS domain-containing sensor histidine kinase [Bacteroidota bacterium]